MNCVHCSAHGCRSLSECGAVRFEKDAVRAQYLSPENSRVVQTAATLVDHGRAGTLNRLEEIIEFSKSNGWNHLGLAYCYGMEEDARKIAAILKRRGLRATSVSCTTGGLSQHEVNPGSTLEKVSCNPLGQAAQLNAEEVQLVIIVGLCLGHDLLFQKSIAAPATTLVVKDRTSGHHPLMAIRAMTSE